MFFFEILVVVFLGLVLGSFSTALIYRVPRKLSWVGGRSSCTACKSYLSARDLIPVFSWVLSGGKCRHCSDKISAKYPVIEFVSVVLCLLVYFSSIDISDKIFLILVVPILLSLFVIDLEHMILPNQLSLILFVIGVIRLFYNAVSDFSDIDYYFIEYVVGTFVYVIFAWGLGAIFTKVLKKDALGFGDVKFFGVAGIWLGLSSLSYFMILSGGLAILFSIIWRMAIKSEVFPFGPSLIASFYLILLYHGTFFA